MRVSTGIVGLDRVLRGGLLPSRAYLVCGESGTGKTTTGLHFLSAAKGTHERTLMLSLAEPEENIRADAAGVGLNIDEVSIVDLTPAPETFTEAGPYDIFSPGEVEREPLTRKIAEAIEKAEAKRIFVDGFGQLRHLAPDSFHHHRLVQSFFRFTAQRGATVMVASHEADLQPVVDGVIHLEFEGGARTLRVGKMRGSDFLAGIHAMRLTGSGMEVLPNAA